MRAIIAKTRTLKNMSTRCQIAFYQAEPKDLNKFESLIYRHSDGYPTGVLPDILPFLKLWVKNRGIEDIEYCSARLLQKLCNEYDKGMNEMYEGKTGYGICVELHGDIEYLYAVYPNKVNVYEVKFGDEDINERAAKIDSEAL